MSEELIDKYVDRAKFGQDTEFIESELTKIINLFKTINGADIKVNGSSSLKDITASTEQGIKANARLVESVKAVNKVVDDRFKSEAKLATLNSDYFRQTQANNVETQKTTKEIKAQVAAEQAQIGTRERAAAQIKLLTIQKDKLNLLNKDEAAQYEVLVSKIEKYNSFLVKTGTSREKQAANVGNYQGSAKIIVDALEKEKKKLEELEKTRIRVQNAGAQFNPAVSGGASNNKTVIAGFAGGGGQGGVSQSTAALAQLDKQIEQSRTVVEGFARITEQPKFLNIAGKVGDATAEVRFFTKSLIDLERNGLGNSEAANNLRKQLAELTDQIGDAKAEVKALSSDTRGFDLFAGSVTFAADAFQTFAGAAVLAGASEEDAAEATKTLVAVQSVANGVKGIANELTTRGTAANKLYALAQSQVSIAMDGTATAGARLRAILATIGFGAVVIGIGLLIANFSKIKDAVTGATVATKAYDETLEDYKKGAQDAIQQTDKVGLAFTQAKEGVISKDEALKIYNETLGDTFGKAKSLDEAETLYNSKAATYIEIMGLKAQANALFAKSAEAAAKGITAAQEDQVSTFGKIQTFATASIFGTSAALETATKKQQQGVKEAKDEAKKTEEALKAEATRLATLAETKSKDLNITVTKTETKTGTKAKEKTNDDALKRQLDLEKRNNDAIKALAIERANESIRQSEKILANDQSTLDQQIKAINDIGQQKKNIQAIEFADQIKAQKEIRNGVIVEIKKTAKEKELIETINGNNILKINDDIAVQISEAQKKAKEKEAAALDAANKKKLDDLEANKVETKAITDENYQIEIDALEQRFAKGTLSQEEYNKKRAALDFDYQIKSLQNEVEYQKKLIELSFLSPEKKAEALRELNRLERELAAETANFVKAKEADKLKATLDGIDRIKQVSSQVFEIVGGLLNADAETKKNKIRDEQDAAEKKAARDIEIINQSTASEQDKAAKIAIVNARLAAQKEAFARREREIQLQQAKFQKATAIFNIILNTTQAVIKAYTEGDPYTKVARAILAGVAGAAQLAVAIATPIPRFKSGKSASNNYEGMAVVGDGGRQEIIERSNGQFEITPSKDTLTYVGKDDIIHPDASAWMKMMSKGAENDVNRMFVNKPKVIEPIDLSIEIKKQTSILNKIASKKELHLHSSNAGMQAIWKWGANETNYINQSTNW